jgi:serine/threonine protein kinase
MQINGLVLGKYRIERLINNGSFASVFRAKEELTSRIVAIKALPKSVYPSGRLRYLLTELSAMTLNWGHENIVSIHTVEPGEEEYVAYIVMEFIDGPTLYERMSTESFSPSRAVNIALDICRGLTAVHKQNIIHRDIKPQNILLTSNDIAKLSDFGVARILEATNDIAATLTGTRKYMAPEQYGGEYDYRVDLYSLGLVLYEMLTGRFPFRGKTHDEMKMKKLDGEIEITHDLPNELHGFLQKVLHRNVNKRYQTATEMYQNLDAIRASWYAKTVREALAQSADADMLNGKLASTREELRLSPGIAREIELEIQYQHRIEDERQQRHQLEQETGRCYERAINHIDQNNPTYALRELQEVHRLYSVGTGPSNQAERIFQSLADSLTIAKVPSKADETALLIERLPAGEQEKLRTWFDQQPLANSTGQDPDVPDLVGSNVEDDSLEPRLEPLPNAPPTEPRLAESVLRSMHEDTKYAHERKAAQICHTAERYTRQGNKRARSEYKKLAEYYGQAATGFIASDDWELAADCYARARLAYVAAKRTGSARTIANKAGDCYAKLAENMVRQQRWVEAATQYVMSADHFKHGESEDAAEDGWSHATVHYLNAAESARSDGEIERIYIYCQKILAIAKNIKKPSKAAAAARRLMEEIEGFFAKPPHMPFQNSEPYPSKSVVMRGNTLAANQWQARR